MDHGRKCKVFVDGANVFYAQKKIGWSIDWEKAKNYLNQNWDVVEFRYYVGTKENDRKMQRFTSYLSKVGYTTITKPLKTIKIDSKHPLSRIYNYSEIYKSNFDVEIAVDIMLELDQLDVVVLISGDSDFEYLAKKVRSTGNQLIVFASRKTLSWELKIAATRYVLLERVRTEIERK